MKEFISIIVPIYNAEEFIERCIKSVVNQTVSNWELLLIDDGSTDSTVNICNKYIGDSRIHLLSKKNTGVSDTRNLGIAQSKGNWITFLDADDELEKSYIENLTKIIEKNNFDIIIGEIDSSLGQKYLIESNVTYEGKNKRELISSLLTSKNNNKNYDSKMLGYVIGKVYKKSIIENIRFPTNIKFREDMLFNLKAFSNSKNVLLAKELSYKYIINTKSASFKYIENYIEEIKNFKIILENILSGSDINFHNDLYVCMTNMYMNWIKLCVMHKKSNFSKREKLEEIKKSFKFELWKNVFCQVQFRELTNQYKLLYILYKLKLKRIIYFVVNINMNKNNRLYNR